MYFEQIQNFYCWIQYDVPFSHLAQPLQPVDISGYSDIGMFSLDFRIVFT